MDKRRAVQFLTALLYNAHLPGFWQGRLYRGSLKSVCVPGLNCYSCPGALGACPLGALQSSLSGVFLRFPFYVLGLLILCGLLFGRLICGWGCPFGLIQELLHKIPSPKLRPGTITRRLSLLKYFIAVIFLLLLPLGFYYAQGTGIPAFCKFICPAGTLEAGLPLALANSNIRNNLSWLFGWKMLLLAATIIAAVFIYRPFCSFICPLGAFYGFFNKLALFGITVEQNKCVGCDRCVQHCPMDCRAVGDRECICCGSCQKVCPTQAIRWRKISF